jgi:hypothetical protein
MRGRGGNHGLSAAARVLALAVVGATLLGQFESFSHELTVRHVRCAEHGELTHVPLALASAPATLAATNRGPALERQAGTPADAHEHCGLAFTLEGNAAAPVPQTHGVLPPPPPVPTPAAPRLQSGRTTALSAAPKTSPPQA